MKAGWETTELGAVIQLVSGQHIDAKNYNTDARGIGYLTGPSDFGAMYPTVSKWTESPKVTAKKGDILITVKGSGVGKINLLDQGEVAISRQLMAVRVLRADPKFIYALLGSTFEHFQSASTGAAIPGISREQVLGLRLALPPLLEQRRIVAILDEAFVGLEAMRANAEKNLQNARELFESHIRGVFRHRGDEWTLASIGDIGDCCLGKMLDKAKNKGLPKPYLRNLNVRWFEFALDDLLEMKFEESEIERYSARKGDLLICEGGYPGRAAIWQADEPIFFQKAIHRVRFDDPKKAKILLYFLYCQDRSGELKLHFTGAGIQHFTGQALRRLQIPLPPSNQIDDVIQMFDRLREETERLEGLYREKLVAIDELKQSILQKAFSGELTSSKAIAA